MQKHPTHKSAKGFTLIELVIAVAIIGILTSVAVLGYNQYKVRAYDAHSKQALRDILLQCNAFWLDHDASQVCNHATVAEVYVASDEIVLKFPAEDLPDLPGGSQGNFCASAQHVSSPNPYSIDSASLISEGGDCGGAGGSVQTASVGGSVQTASVSPAQTFETYQPPEEACSGRGGWVVVDSDGKSVQGGGLLGDRKAGAQLVDCTCASCGPGGSFSTAEGLATHQRPNNYKYVFAIPGTHPCMQNLPDTGWEGCMKAMGRSGEFNFETGIWSNDRGGEFKNGERVE